MEYIRQRAIIKDEKKYELEKRLTYNVERFLVDEDYGGRCTQRPYFI